MCCTAVQRTNLWLSIPQYSDTLVRSFLVSNTGSEALDLRYNWLHQWHAAGLHQIPVQPVMLYCCQMSNGINTPCTRLDLPVIPYPDRRVHLNSKACTKHQVKDILLLFALFLLCIVTQLLQCNTNQMHICYNLILHIIFYMFRAWKAHHQEDTHKNTGIMV